MHVLSQYPFVRLWLILSHKSLHAQITQKESWLHTDMCLSVAMLCGNVMWQGLAGNAVAN